MHPYEHLSELAFGRGHRIESQWLAESASMTIDDLIVVGYSKLPAASASHNIGELFALVLQVDAEHHVVAVDCTAATSLMRQWLATGLIGADMTAGPAPIIEWIEQHYLGTAGGSIKQSVHDAWKRYAAHQGAQRKDLP